mmetsp:Transcript_32796/g.55299  ORF Transcript_32796/g.55299 Transcript_32796/m.55299 type:complete len:431 (-) Transcript_32796:162-1454(-)
MSSTNALKAKKAPDTPVQSKKQATRKDFSTPVQTKDSGAAGKKEPSKVTSSKKSKELEDGSGDDTEDEKENNADLSAEMASPGSVKTSLKVNWRVEKAYKILRSVTGQLGGNGYNGAIYGELTMRSMQRVINILVEQCGLNHTSRFIDVGAGLGKPNFHAAQDPAVRLSLGVELEEIRWQLSMHNMDHFLPSVEGSASSSSSAAGRGETLFGGVHFVMDDIDNAQCTDPFTHIYMFDLGFPPPLQKSIAKKFNESVHAECLVSYRPPRRVIHEYGYAVDFVTQVLCSMHGSGEGHTAYIYMRNNNKNNSKNNCKKSAGRNNDKSAPQQSRKGSAAARSSSSSSSSSVSSALPAAIHGQRLLKIPAREGFEEVDEEVFCDEAFYAACALAVDPDVAPLKAEVKRVVQAHLNSSARGKRERKPRIITDAGNF